MRTLGGTLGSNTPEKYAAKGSAAMSAADSSCGCCSGSAAGSDVDGTSAARVDGPASGSAAGFAVRNEGSYSRVLSSVRGTFCASRFYVAETIKSVKICCMRGHVPSLLVGHSPLSWPARASF